MVTIVLGVVALIVVVGVTIKMWKVYKKKQGIKNLEEKAAIEEWRKTHPKEEK